MAVGRGKTLGFFFLVSRCIRKAIKCLYINLSVYVCGIQHYTYIYIYYKHRCCGTLRMFMLGGRCCAYKKRLNSLTLLLSPTLAQSVPPALYPCHCCCVTGSGKSNGWVLYSAHSPVQKVQFTGISDISPARTLT